MLVEKLGWRHASQLPMKFPFVQRLMTPHVDWMKHRHVLLGLLVLFLAGSAVIVVQRGSDLLGMEFRGGTAVTLSFKQKPGTGEKVEFLTLDRAEVEKRVKAVAAAAPASSPLRRLDEAQIIAVNPEQNQVTSHIFTIKSRITDPNAVQQALSTAFADMLAQRQALTFEGVEARADRGAPLYPITTPVLGESIDRSDVRTPSGEFYNGLAIVLSNINPPVSLKELQSRLDETRTKSEYSDTLSRRHTIKALGGSDSAVSSAVILVQDPNTPYVPNDTQWTSNVRDREWKLVHESLAENQTLASVQSFSAAIARSFAAQGIVCTLLSLLLLTIYVFVRFGTVRWAIAATVPLFADVIGILGLIGVAQLLYESPATHPFARAVGLLPFDLDLSQIAAILTIVGYSLNDKIIILDRIRENKGKLPYASYEVINDSINQTLSRTVITAGAHMITTIVLYVFGGEAVRGFAYTFNLGVLLGTYTSIVSTPLVWSGVHDKSGKSEAERMRAAGHPDGRPLPPGTNGDRASHGADRIRPAAEEEAA